MDPFSESYHSPDAAHRAGTSTPATTGTDPYGLVFNGKTRAVTARSASSNSAIRRTRAASARAPIPRPMPAPTRNSFTRSELPGTPPIDSAKFSPQQPHEHRGVEQRGRRCAEGQPAEPERADEHQVDGDVEHHRHGTDDDRRPAVAEGVERGHRQLHRRVAYQPWRIAHELSLIH